jgi:biotin carboxylase
MRTVAFVAPFLLPATIRFLRSVVEQKGVRVGLISADPVQMLPADLRQRLAAHHLTPKAGALSAAAIHSGVQRLASVLGGMPQLLLSTLEELQVPLAEVRAALGIPGMRPRQATNFREKSQMKDALRAAGLPCARHQRVDSVEAGMAFGATVKFAAVVKPLDGAGGKATYRVRSHDEMRAALQRLHPHPGRPVQCEEFVLGEERTLEVISLAGQPVWCSSCRYMPTPLAAIENPWIQWTVTLPREEDDPADATVRDLGFRALKALGMGSGLSHMEWFRRRDGSIAISEIGARPPGAQIVALNSYAHDFDLYKAWGRAVTFDKFTAPRRKYAVGAAFLRGQGSGDRITSINGLDAAQKKMGEWVVEAKLPRIGQRRSSSYEGEGYVIIRHPETALVDRSIGQLITTVQVRCD